MLKRLLNTFFAIYYREWWNIAICDIGEDLTPQNIHWVKPTYKDRWFADPFIISDDTDSYKVLVEEYFVPARKGRLARLTISKDNYEILENETILDLPTHLSFPNFMKVNGDYIVYPENSKSGSLSYYSYGKSLESGKILINQPLTDAVIFKQGEDYYLLATSLSTCNGNVCEVFKSSSSLSGYKLFQKIEFSDNIARGAGNVFVYEGRIIRPAQVCNNAYGEGLCFQELTIIDGKVNLKEIKRLKPLTREYPNGFHTYNVYGNKVIIDGYRYRSPLLRVVCKCILKLHDIRSGKRI